jgi:hypothetical protein
MARNGRFGTLLSEGIVRVARKDDVQKIRTGFQVSTGPLRYDRDIASQKDLR